MSVLRKIFFALGVWGAFFLLLEGLLAIGGVRPDVEADDPFAGFAASVPLYVRSTGESGRAEWRTARNKRRFFNDQVFADAKPAGTRRLFCLGGSTTYGRPYSDATSFCGWLRELLPEADARSRWEVVNAGGISYASYRVAALMPELARHDPDVFVIYTGHNEFLEERTYASLRDRNRLLRRVESVLRHTHIDAALRRLIAPAQGRAPAASSGEVETVLDRSIGPAAYRRDDVLRERVLDQYRDNLERIVRSARSAGASPLLIVPAANLRDCSPFKSTHDDSIPAPARAAWQQAVDRGRGRLAEGRTSEARAAFAEAVAIDPRRADGWYALGRTQLLLAENEAAEQSLRRARDEDVCPLRAISPIPRIVREVAAELDVPLVDFEALIARRVTATFGHAAPGDDWFLDHVHPTVEGHRQLALALLAKMQDRVWMEPPPSWGDEAIARVTARVLDGVDDHGHGLALRNLAKVLSWAGKSSDAARTARRALALLDEDAECHFILGAAAAEDGRWEEAVAEYEHAVRLEPDYAKARNNLGTALARLGRDEEAITQYEQVLTLDPDHANARFNLGNALLRQGRVEAAIAHYREVLHDDADDTDARFNLARAHARRGDWAQAAAEYRLLLETDPDDLEARQALEAALARTDGRDALAD